MKPSFTIGIEEEYQTIDPVTFDLRSHINAEIISKGKRQLDERIKAEMHQSVVEVGTGVCRNMKEARADIINLRRAMVKLAKENGLLLCAGATHPFADWRAQDIYPDERYLQVVEDMQLVARSVVRGDADWLVRPDVVAPHACSAPCGIHLRRPQPAGVRLPPDSHRAAVRPGGTLNFADLARAWPERRTPGLDAALSMLFLTAFGIKAGLFPLFFWLPASYHTPPAAIGALLAGLLTKVGVYSMIRVFTLLFPDPTASVYTALLVHVGRHDGRWPDRAPSASRICVVSSPSI